VLPGNITHPFSAKRRASPDGGREQRTIEDGPWRNRKLRCRATSVTEHDVRTPSTIFERDIADRHRTDGGRIDSIANEIQRAPGHTATARLLARMARIEYHDPYSGARETPR
jgi:hypothetical protein